MTTVIEPTLFDEPTAAPVDKETASLLLLVAGDPLHVDDRIRVIEAILRTARDHGGLVDMNNVRALLWRDGQCTVFPNVIGATVNSLKRAGRLVFKDEWAVTTGSTTGNTGKPQRVYHWRTP